MLYLRPVWISNTGALGGAPSYLRNFELFGTAEIDDSVMDLTDLGAAEVDGAKEGRPLITPPESTSLIPPSPGKMLCS
jgi:hypothetical protein